MFGSNDIAQVFGRKRSGVVQPSEQGQDLHNIEKNYKRLLQTLKV